MASVALQLAEWAHDHANDPEDVALADRSLLDTLGAAVAGRSEPATRYAAILGEAGRWAVSAHVTDYDDLHMQSTAHVSAICVPAAIACGGGRTAYLAGAGVMARLGVALGWRHYTAGWHATCTAGAPAAAVAAATAWGLSTDRIAVAMALALPAAGGVQRAFGTDTKSLQVGFAVDAGVRAARLAQAGATADLASVDEWLSLVGGDPDRCHIPGPAVPGGLAVKLHPCCYALQRPIEAVADLRTSGIDPRRVDRIVVRTPAGSVTPLIDRDPHTGLEGKFNLRYAVAAALLDDATGLGSFTDSAVARPEAARLMRLTQVILDDGGNGLLDGQLRVDIRAAGQEYTLTKQLPTGAPGRPVSPAQLNDKVSECLSGTGLHPGDLSWETAATVLRAQIPATTAPTARATEMHMAALQENPAAGGVAAGIAEPRASHP